MGKSISLFIGLFVGLAAVFGCCRDAFAADGYPDPHKDRIAKFSSNEHGIVSASFQGVFGIINDNAKTPGGDEFHVADTFLNGFVDYTRDAGDGQFGLSWDFIVPRSTLIEGMLGDNRILIKGYLARPEHLIKGYYQKYLGNNLFEVYIGQDLFAGFEPLEKTTNYFAALPPLFVHSQQYDQGVGVKIGNQTDNGRKVWEVDAGVVNGDGGFGMAHTSSKVFHNSYPSYTLTGEIHPLYLLGLNPDEDVFGDIGFEFSYACIDRGSNPGSKRYGNHMLVGVSWEKEIAGKTFKTRVSTGELGRGLTQVGEETTDGLVFEASLGNIECCKGSLTVYGYYSTFNYSSGPKQELWRSGTSYQDQYGIGMRLDSPFGCKRASISGGVVFRDMDGEGSWGILSNSGSEIYYLEAAIAVP